jgi:uncharacterized protein YfbU (UPF0304 family)
MMKRLSLCISGVEEGTEIQTKEIENIFNEIIEENSQNTGKEMDIQVQRIFRIPKRHSQEITSLTIFWLKCQQYRIKREY